MLKTMLKCAGASDPGRVRRNNEDAFYMDVDRGIFLVVDGIGGQAAGEKAAEIAVGRVRARLERQIGTAEQRVREAIANANKEILQAARANPEWAGMACVLTVAVLENGSAVIGHVGDSRLYHIRGGKITKVTHDHSPVGEREESGELSEAEAMRHPRRNEVYRDVGSEDHTPDDDDFIELRRIAFDGESALLLCSDGLSDQVASAEIRATVERHAGEPERAVRELIEAANRAGGKDNVTVLVVEGDQFVAPRDPGPEAAPRASVLASRPAWFLYGLLAAGAAAYFSRPLWIPPPVIEKPRVLVAGKDQTYSTISAALADAKAGDTVEVLVGDYRERLLLKSGVMVRSRAPREAVIRAAAPGGGPAVVAQNVEGAALAGFQIVGDPQMPLSPAVLLDNSKVLLEDLDIGGAGVGIQIRGGAPMLVGNAIHDGLAEGVIVDNGATPWISHNSFQRNKGAGLAARAGTKPALVDNVFEKNPIDLPADAPKERDFLIDVPKTQGKKK